MAGFARERRSPDRQANWTGAERRRPASQPTVIGEMLDPTAEEAYWRENYQNEPYYQAGYAYDDYHPAYCTGWEGRARYEGRSFDEVERELEADYSRRRGSSRLGWDRNRAAARAAWDRFDVTDQFERSQ
jgi:hypothetical protein